MHRPGAAAGDHLPHIRIPPRPRRLRLADQQAARLVPRNAALQVHIDCPAVEHGLYVAHSRQPPLRQDVHLHEADRFHGIHVKVSRGVALVGDERRRQLAHRLARKHQTARVHLRVTRHPVEDFRHFQRCPVRLLLERQVTSFRTGAEQFNQARAALWRRLVGHPTAAEAPRKILGEFPHVAFP